MELPHLLDGRLKLRHLVLVDAVTEHGTLVAAGAHLHISQPALTRALHELETILGVPLYERTRLGLTPTVFGVAFTEHARTVLAQLRQAGRHVAELADGRAGTVVVGVHLAGSNLLLPTAVARLKAERPQVTVVIREASPEVLLAELEAGRVDFIVGRLTGPPQGRTVQQVHLYEEPISLVARRGHPAHLLERPTLADLVSFPWILPGAETALRRELEDVFARQRVPLPTDRVECTSILTLRQLLTQTDMIACLPALIARDDGRLAVLGVPLEPTSRTVGLTLAAGRSLNPSAQALVEHLQRVSPDL